MTLLVLYQLLYPLVALAALARVAGAGRWGAFREGWADASERLGRPAWPKTRGKVLWLHAASVGEVSALGPFIAGIVGAQVVVTCSTAAGREKARGLPGVRAAFLAPADFYPCVASFLRRARPAVLLTAESELWPMTLVLARRRGARLGLVNACLSERSAGRWLRARGLAALALSGVERAAFQTREDLDRFIALGLPAEGAAVTGNPKHDLAAPVPSAVEEARRRLAALFKAAPAWVAGSTRPGEEELVAAAHQLALKLVPGLKLVVAPRHPERAGDAEAALRKAGLSVVRWTELLPFNANPDCLLVDSMGVLGSLYAACPAAFVGGTLVAGSGGHNVIEPAALGTPVLFGPHTEAVAAEAASLEASGGGRRVNTPEALAEALAAWLNDPAARKSAAGAARKTAGAFSGATGRTLAHLAPLLGTHPA